MLECNTDMFLTGWDSVHYEIHIFPAGFMTVSLHFWDWIWTYNNPSGFLQLLLPMSAVTSVDWFSGSEMDAWSGSWSTLRSSSLTSCWLWLRSERSSENSSSSLRNTHTHTSWWMRRIITESEMFCWSHQKHTDSVLSTNLWKHDSSKD